MMLARSGMPCAAALRRGAPRSFGSSVNEQLLHAGGLPLWISGSFSELDSNGMFGRARSERAFR